MQVLVINTDLAAVAEIGQKHPECKTPLTAVGGDVVARSHQTAAQQIASHAVRRQTARPPTDHRIGKAATVRDGVQGGEKGAHRIDLYLVEPEQVEAFERVVLGERIRDVDGRRTQEGVLQICSRRAQLGDIDRVDVRQRLANERVLTPGNHLLAQTNRQVLVRQQVFVDIGIGDVAVLLGAIFRGFRKILIRHLEIVEPVAPRQGAVAVALDLQGMRALDHVGENVPLVLEQMAIAVDALIERIGLCRAHRKTPREVRVEGGLQLSDLKVHRQSRARNQARGSGRNRCA